MKREQISTTKHLFIFCFTAENRPRNRFSVLATTRNFPQEHGPTTVLLEEEGLLWNTFLQTAKDLLLSQSHLRGTSKICFLPGHNFCWNWWPMIRVSMFWTWINDARGGMIRTTIDCCYLRIPEESMQTKKTDLHDRTNVCSPSWVQHSTERTKKSGGGREPNRAQRAELSRGVVALW